MKRYIEIVYDNSGSMNGFVGGRVKHTVALELFEKEILPTIALDGDNVVLRLLRPGCEHHHSHSESLTKTYGRDRMAMADRLKRISHDQTTPLFLTISDSIEACKREYADEYLIFVLTDGDDTCGIRIEELIDRDLIEKYVKFFNVLVVQFAVESPISRNNLTALASYLGGKSIQLDGHDSVGIMRSKLKKALSVSGFSKKLPLEYCFDSVPGFEIDWNEIQERGIDFHQATLLYNKGMLSWKPEIDKRVKAIEYAELKFLFGLTFKSGLPDQIVEYMLRQLKNPYNYSHDCIYWDFGKARWRYFQTQNLTAQIDNPHAGSEDGSSIDSSEYSSQHSHETYEQDYVYRVEMTHAIMPQFILVPLGITDWTKELKPGDQVKFSLRR